MFLTAKSQIEDYRAKGWWGTKTVDDMLQDAISAHPADTALVDPLNREMLDDVPPRSLSWTDLGQEVEKTAAALLARGLKKDDRLVVQLPNTVDAVIIFLAAARIGRLYYGAADPKSGGVAQGARVFAHPQCHHVPEVFDNISGPEAEALLKAFFSAKRKG